MKMEKTALVIVVLNLMYLAQAQFPVDPLYYNYTASQVVTANGSSATGGCFHVTAYLRRSYSTCDTPTSSVLFDGVIPTLTELDGDTWARQLMITGQNYYYYISFTNITWVRRLEAVMFNCPQWDTSVNYIQITAMRPFYRNFPIAFTPVHSCDSLVKVCIPIDTNSSEIRMYFRSLTNYIHLAEVAFYESSTPCPPFTMIPGNWTPATTPATTQDTSTDMGSSQAENNKDPSLILFVTAALQTTVIVFMVVVVVGVVCKYSRKKTTPRPHDANGSVKMEDELYEIMDPGEDVANKNKTRKRERFALPLLRKSC